MQLFDQKNPEQDETVSHCSFSTLLKQNAQARLLIRASHKIKHGNSRIKNIHATQSGKHLSAYKGQGMDFHESRMYQAGDDIRHIDWRVTARTGKPYTKVFIEEKERPVQLIVDMRKPMFFGTRTCYKSVLSAKIASLLVWKTLLEGDKAGGVILSDSDFNPDHIHKPSRNQAAASRFVNSLAKATQTVSFSNNPMSLSDSLKHIHSLIEKGSQLIVLSDFRGLDEQSKRIFLTLANTSSLALLSISDPFEELLTSNTSQITGGTTTQTRENFLLSDGHNRVRLNQEMRLKFQHQLEKRQHFLEELSRQPNIHGMALSTADKTSTILSKLLSMPMLSGGFR